MALAKLVDRVKETTSTTGTGPINLEGAYSGYQSFLSAVGSGSTTYYCIAHDQASDWEVGIGTVGNGQLFREVVLASSNGGEFVAFSRGTKDVFVTYPAVKHVALDTDGNVNLPDTEISAKLFSGSFSGEFNVSSGSAHLQTLDVSQTLNATGSINLSGSVSATGPINLNGPVTATGSIDLSGSMQTGHIGIDATPRNDRALYVYARTNGSSSQYGAVIEAANPSIEATTAIRAMFLRSSTPAAAFTTVELSGLYVSNATKGVGSSITNQYGIYVDNQDQGTNNYAIWTQAGKVRLGDELLATAGVKITGNASLSSGMFTFKNVANGIRFNLTNDTDAANDPLIYVASGKLKLVDFTTGVKGVTIDTATGAVSMSNALSVTSTITQGGIPVSLNGHTHAISDLSDVTITTPSGSHVLRHNGTKWVNTTLNFVDLSNKPTTISGYGITDALTTGGGGTYNGNLVAGNYGIGTVGLYDSSKTRMIHGMGTAYAMPAAGYSTGATIGASVYALAYSFDGAPGAKSGLSHQILLLSSGETVSAMGNHIWTKGNYQLGTNGCGLYSIPNGSYFIATGSLWEAYVGSADGGIKILSNTSVAKGYLYWNSLGFGLLNGAGQWNIQGNITTQGGSMYGTWDIASIREGGTALSTKYAARNTGIDNIGAPSTYGSMTVSGANTGYAGIYFSGVGQYLMVSSAIQGFYNGSTWAWYFNNGELTTGTVPWARLSGIPTFASRWPAFSEVTGTLAVSQISATGTRDSTTFLRGDGVWSDAGIQGILSYRNSDQVLINNSDYQSVIYNIVKAGQSSWLNTSTGVITVPSAGLYYIEFSAARPVGNGFQIVKLFINGADILTHSLDSDAVSPVSWTTTLTANSTIFVKAKDNSTGVTIKGDEWHTNFKVIRLGNI